MSDDERDDLKDIFGDDNIDDDDDDVAPSSAKKPLSRLSKKADMKRGLSALDEEDDGLAAIFGGSDDDNDDGADSDDKVSSKKVASNKKKLFKRKSKDSGDDGPKKKKKRKDKDSKAAGVDKSSTGDQKASGNASESDEYGSDSEGEADDADKQFIADEDDNDDIVAEYNEDNTDFNDERPERRKGGKKKDTSAAAAVSTKKSSKSNESTLPEFKVKKPVEMSEEELLAQAHQFVELMDDARKSDDFRQPGTPPLNKINLLDKIALNFSIKKLRPMLYKAGALNKVREWLSPNPQTKRLPLLTVRSRLYKVVLDLPYDADVIKAAKLGPLIKFLSEHPEETVDNKKVLNAIIQKWSREMHNQADNGYVSTLNASDELQRAAAYQRLNVSAKANKAVNSTEIDAIVNSNKDKTSSGRFYDPNFTGYIFTVKAESSATATENTVKDVSRELLAFARTRAKKVGKQTYKAAAVDASGRDKL